MNVFIFGIGGTGARVLRSLVYCLAANMGDYPAGVNFIPMIIDHDHSNKDKKRALETLEKYKSISGVARHEDGVPGQDERRFFLPGMKYLSEISLGRQDIQPNFPSSFEFQFGIGNNNSAGTFADYINLNAMNGELSITNDLLRALYSDAPTYVEINNKREENPIAELNLDLGKGYRGNPNIGTVVFDSIEDTDAYQYFTKNFLPNQDMVVIVGSIFGGTGSSGIPKLIEAIRTNSTAGWNSAKVAGIMVMPYFKVDTPNETEDITPAIQDTIFKSKQKAALSFYNKCKIGNRTMNYSFDSIYYVAEEDSRQQRHAYSEGGDDQRNNANIVELIASMGIIDFVQKVVAGANLTQFNEYGLESDSNPQHSLWLKHFCDEHKSTYLKRLTQFALAAKHYRDHIIAGKTKESAAYYGNSGLKIADNKNTGIYKDLTMFVNLFADWLDELGSAEHSFAPYNFSKNVDLMKVVNGYISREGGLFNSNGVSYKDFDSLCSKSWADGTKNLSNKNAALLKVLYDASVKEADYATHTPEKTK